MLPGGDGGSGTRGGNGGDGGKVTIRYASAVQAPTADAAGGAGGKGGSGGRGGAGKPRGKNGRSGGRGRNGAPGTIDIQQLEAAEVWKLLDAESARQWAAYRAEVAGFFFRQFDPQSQLFALDEARTALLLNPADADAIAIRERIANRQIPSGLARDLDIAPDFRALSANLTAEIALVQNSFAAYAGVASLAEIEQAIADNLRLMAGQLASRRIEAQAEIAVARQDVRIAQAEISGVDLQIKDIDSQIGALAEERFSIGDMLSDVATVAAVVAGMATGVGAVVSVAAGLVTLKRVLDDRDLVDFLKILKESPDPNSRTSDDVEEIKKLGGGMKDLIEGANSFISFTKLLADLDGARAMPGQDATGKLLKQQLLLVRQKMVGRLRETQAHTRVAAAELRVSNLERDIAQALRMLESWSAEEAALEAASELLIRAARNLVDMVMEDVFLAQRAREIYQLDRIGGLRFDYGYLHPDVDRGLTPAVRAMRSLVSLSGMAIQVLAWDKIFQQLNTAQIGFDVVHPQLSVAITDAARLQEFAGGAALDFSIDLADVPSKMFELKVNALGLELTDASSEQSTNFWMTHSGHWRMNRRTDGSVADLLLLPRSELFACGRGSGSLSAKIPANAQSSAEPGPPFSFWGRGVATTFRLQIAQPAAVDLSRLSAIRVTIDCIGYAPQGTA